MMRIVTSFILVFATVQAIAQNYIDAHGGISNLKADAWNETIRTYNASRFWQEDKLSELNNAITFGLGFSGVLGKGIFISPTLQYSKFSAESNSESIDLHWMDLGIAFDIFPLEFGLDSVAYQIRPFARMGFSGSMLLPRVELLDGIASIDGEAYEPFNWPYLFHAGLGLRYQPSNVLGFFFLLDGRYVPNARLNDFRTALLGSLYANTSDQNTARLLGIRLGLTFRIKD
jgi:hypothetical protein